MKRFSIAALLGCLVLGACENGPSVPPDAILAAECRTYAATLRSLAAVKSRLSESQIRTVDTVKSINGPLCLEAAAAGQSGVDFDYPAAVSIVLKTTAQLSRIAGESN